MYRSRSLAGLSARNDLIGHFLNELEKKIKSLKVILGAW